MSLPCRAALLVIDVQQGLDDPRWGARNNPAAEQRIADLLAPWRATADIMHRVTLASLHGEFATVQSTADVLAAAEA